MKNKEIIIELLQKAIGAEDFGLVEEALKILTTEQDNPFDDYEDWDEEFKNEV